MSPNKTVEGLLGGCVAAMLAMATGALLMDWPRPLLSGACYGLLCAVMARPTHSSPNCMLMNRACCGLVCAVMARPTREAPLPVHSAPPTSSLHWDVRGR